VSTILQMQKSDPPPTQRRLPLIDGVVAELVGAPPPCLDQPFGRLSFTTRFALLPGARVAINVWLRYAGREDLKAALDQALWEFRTQKCLQRDKWKARDAKAAIRKRVPTFTSRGVIRALYVLRGLAGELFGHHSLYLRFSCNLVQRLEWQKDWSRARAIQEDTWKLLRDRFGPDNRDACIAQACLAMLVFGEGKSKRALALMAEALPRCERALRGDHPIVLIHAANLAWINYHVDGNAASARKRLEQLLPQCLSKISRTDPLPIESHIRDLLVEESILADDAEGSLADDKARDILARVERDCGRDHPRWLQGAQALVRILRKKRDFRAARQIQTEVLWRSRQMFGPDFPETWEAGLALASLLLDTRDYKGCSTLCLEVMLGATHSTQRGAVIFRAADQVAEVLCRLCATRALPVHIQDVVFKRLSELANRLRLDVELGDASVRAQVGEDLERFLTKWLDLCYRYAPNRSLEPLQALHGWDAWSIALDEVISSNPTLINYKEEALFSQARRALTEVRSRLTEVDTRIRTLDAGLNKPESESTRVLRQYANQRDHLMLLEMEFLRTYKEARNGLARVNPEFGATKLSSLNSLLDIARLERGAALVVLFKIRDQVRALVLRAGGATDWCEFPGIQRFVDAFDRYLAPSNQVGRDAVLRGWRQGSAKPAEGAALSLESLAKLGATTWWEPLRSLDPAVKEWHVITGPGLHGLPLGLGRPNVPAYLYPGLPVFYRARAHRSCAPQPAPQSLLMAVDAASTTSTPLPFVETEARVISHVMKQVGIRVQEVHGMELLDSSAGTAWMQVSGHGVIEGGAGEAHGTVLLNSALKIVLDPSDSSRFSPGLRAAYFAVCDVGRTGSTQIGGALGLPPALLLRGMSVIGALAPLPDFYMPIVSALYYYARVKPLIGSSNGLPSKAQDALDCAREQLRSGLWPEPVVQLLRETYRDRMNRLLNRIAYLNAHPADRETLCLARSVVFGWCLSDDMKLPLADELRNRHEKACLLKFAREYCRTPSQRESVVTEVLARLIEQRENPPAEVREAFEHISSFLMSWGDG
jgi:hypothetical protein